MPSPEARKNLPNPKSEFDLEKDLLGPNLRLKKQLSAGELKSLEESEILLSTWFPYSSLGPEGIVAVGEIYRDCYQTFGLKRIDKISQLGGIALLHDEASFFLPPWMGNMQMHRTSTSRWVHSLTTAVLNELMLRNNAFDERRVKKGITLSLLHDSAIFPFSDLAVIEPRFNEDENLPLYLEQINKTERENFEKKYDVVCSEIPGMIKGEGILGSFHKIADRLAYTAYDSLFFEIFLRGKRKMLSKKGENPLEELVDIFEKQPRLFDIFKEVKFDAEKETVYFEDSQKMALFLRVRALMFAHVYLNPERLKFQALVRRSMSNLSAEGKTSIIKEFLKMTDLDLSSKIYPFFQVAREEVSNKVGFLRYKSRRDLNGVLTGASGLPKPPDFFWTEEVLGFDTLTHLPARDPKDGKIKPFSQICPHETAGLEKLNRQTQGVVAYFLKE